VSPRVPSGRRERNRVNDRRNNRRNDRNNERPEKNGAQSPQSPSLLRRIPPSARRALAVVALAALAGIAAFVVVSNEPNTYQRQSSFAIRPSEAVPPGTVPDVVGTLSNTDNAVTETIVDIVGSARVRDSAARAAGLSPDSVAASGAKYSWTAAHRPGSAIVDLTVTGPDDGKLAEMQAAAGPDAARVVQANYSVYRLESLGAPTSSQQVGPKTKQSVALAVLVGALLGIGLLIVERKLRESLGARTLEPGPDGRPIATGDLTDETDLLESTLRDSLGTGASVRRVGPGRIEVAPPDAAPDRETTRPDR
jgi:capsular polysaccharide biosynthesis protein